MKNRWILWLIILAFTSQTLWASHAEPAPLAPTMGLSAKHALLLDADSGQVLYAKDCDTPAPMASTTKIMTTLLLLEAGDPDAIVTITEPMLRGAEGTALGLRVGDEISRLALAYGMLLASGNDAANATAVHLAGSIPAFAAQMNQRATELGMRRTHFVTPSGLDAPTHQSTAYDMALLAQAALRNPLFAKIATTRSTRIWFGAPPVPRTLTNHNRLLRELPGCIGIKTGFTRKAGRCLVSAVEQNGRRLIAITLSAPNDWDDHRELYAFAFSQYHAIALDSPSAPLLRMPVVGGVSSSVWVVLAGVPTAHVRTMPFHLRRELLLRPFEYAPLPPGKIVGTARYYSGDVLLAEVPLLVRDAVAIARPQTPPKASGLRQRIRDFFAS